MKTDAHHHLLMGANRHDLEHSFGTPLPPFSTFEPDATDPIGRLNRWIVQFYVPLLARPNFLDVVLSSVFQTATADGVQRLETSISVGFPAKYSWTPAAFLQKIEHVRRQTSPELEVRIDLGFDRTQDLSQLERDFEAFLETGSPLLCGVDLYDVENAQPPEVFRPLYQKAHRAGLRCKAHVGEFGSAESVRHTVEVLELDAVQHGIHAADMPEVARWLARQKIPLHLAPASNRALKAIDFSTHPIQKLRDAGVLLSFHTDDYLLFETSISQQEKDFAHS
ncbi:MAG: hypothetical protein Q4D98_08995 [Planctomycetia bacterium]|nr:hypothetical protein [Planctomycetia bacterium]